MLSNAVSRLRLAIKHFKFTADFNFVTAQTLLIYPSAANILIYSYKRGGPKVTGLFQYIKIRMKYKFY